MKQLSDLLKGDFTKEFLKHPRHKIIDEIWARVNTDRVAQGYKPLTKRYFAVKLAPIPLEDQFYLLKKMQQSMSQSKVFFGLLKVKKDEQKSN